MNLTVKELLQSGVHFGHQTRRWNPKMKKYIFTARNGIYIIDLHKTLLSIQRAVSKVKEVVNNDGIVLMVGTKKQAKDVIMTEAKRADTFYVAERWLGGMMTNFQTIKQSIKRMKNLEKMETDGTFQKISKKERLILTNDKEKLSKVLEGIRDMIKLPNLLFVVDAKKERIAVAEANKLNIPVISIIDTNTDPDPIDYPIAANDDSIKSISIITKQIADAIIEAKQKASADEFEEVTETTTESNVSNIKNNEVEEKASETDNATESTDSITQKTDNN